MDQSKKVCPKFMCQNPSLSFSPLFYHSGKFSSDIGCHGHLRPTKMLYKFLASYKEAVKEYLYLVVISYSFGFPLKLLLSP